MADQTSTALNPGRAHGDGAPRHDSEPGEQGNQRKGTDRGEAETSSRLSR